MHPYAFDPLLSVVFTAVEHINEIFHTSLLFSIDVFGDDEVRDKDDIHKNTDKLVQGRKQNRKMLPKSFIFNAFDIADVAECLIDEIRMHITGMSGYS